MSKIVSPTQVNYVPGRQIVDNIIIAHEVLHKFKTSKGKNGFIAWKIDLSKAYDRLQWHFIKDVLWEARIREKLSHIINGAIIAKKWKPIKVARGGAAISHLFFADDLILFGEANIQHATIMHDCLETFCGLSGQQVNFEKSKIFCSLNTDRAIARQIAATSGSPLTNSLGSYLGVPLIHFRVNKDTWSHVVMKV
ncbi:hypothetical protein L3X38_038627 [Prunus dulcis]|uniref:Reverse transcriptase domain-containing protein n=1 Tax=Prunus dulcis TaxID=3755 RepID=A0AAD4V6V0_PRUDU|nr:hypothetical protein L3X38_038627 [Prunus dulcis]